MSPPGTRTSKRAAPGELVEGAITDAMPSSNSHETVMGAKSFSSRLLKGLTVGIRRGIIIGKPSRLPSTKFRPISNRQAMPSHSAFSSGVSRTNAFFCFCQRSRCEYSQHFRHSLTRVGHKAGSDGVPMDVTMGLCSCRGKLIRKIERDLT